MATKDPPSASNESRKHGTWEHGTSEQKPAPQPYGPGREDARPGVRWSQPLLSAAGAGPSSSRGSTGCLLPRPGLRTPRGSEIPHGHAGTHPRWHGWHAIRTTDDRLWAAGSRGLRSAEPGLLRPAWPPTTHWSAAVPLPPAGPPLPGSALSPTQPAWGPRPLSPGPRASTGGSTSDPAALQPGTTAAAGSPAGPGRASGSGPPAQLPPAARTPRAAASTAAAPLAAARTPTAARKGGPSTGPATPRPSTTPSPPATRQPPILPEPPPISRPRWTPTAAGSVSAGPALTLLPDPTPAAVALPAVSTSATGALPGLVQLPVQRSPLQPAYDFQQEWRRGQHAGTAF